MSRNWIAMICLAVLSAPFVARTVSAEVISYVTASDANFAARLEALEAELATLRGSANSGDCPSNTCNSCGCSQGGYIAGAELAVLTPYNGALRIVDGGTQIVTPNYDAKASLRFWLGYRNDEGLGGRIRYWTIDANAGPAIPTGVVRSLHMETLDFEVTQTEQLYHWNLDFSGGLRWAQDRNDLLGGPGLALTQDFQGAGGTVAVGAWRPFGWRGLSLFASARASLLYGTNNFQFVDSQNQTPLPQGLLQSVNNVVSVYESQLGIEWASTTAGGTRWYLRTALEAQAWNLPSAELGLLDDTTGLVGVAFAGGINY